MSVFRASAWAVIAAALAAGTAYASGSPGRGQESSALIVTEQSRSFVSARVGIPVEIRLQAQAGTGFSWIPTRGAGSLTEMKALRGSRAMAGGTQVQRFRFVAQRPGNYRLAFSYDQPWRGGTKGARTKAFMIAVR